MSIKIRVSSTVSDLVTENSFRKDLSIYQLKDKLQLITGAIAGFIELSILNEQGNFLYKLDDDSRTLADYPIKDNYILHVKDKSGRKLLEDSSNIPKYELTDEQYASRPDSIRALKERLKVGRFAEKNEEEEKRKEKLKEEKRILEKQKAEIIRIGSRCEVSILDQSKKRGVVKFVGLTDFKPGYWVGIQYDEPFGKHNGSINGKIYFNCPDKYGIFVKPEFVEVGDFPEIGAEEDDEM